jgi:hypothetical protein
MQSWPQLSYTNAKPTYETLHMWSQIAGKIKLAKLPWINHSWHVTLQVTPFGLTTGDIPDREKHFQLDFDFLNHQLRIFTSEGQERKYDLNTLSVADCYHKTLSCLGDFGIACKINPIPSEIENPTPLHLNTVEGTYHAKDAEDLHQALLRTNEVFSQFRGGFIGKCSPVHFFWGGFDLAVTRFSGREAPLHPGGVPNMPDWVAQEAYSHEVSSCGFWPGNEVWPFAAYYSYIYPEPDHYKTMQVVPGSAYYEKGLGEFLLPYKDVQLSENPAETLICFLKSTYEAAADLSGWDRNKLEKQLPGI